MKELFSKDTLAIIKKVCLFIIDIINYFEEKDNPKPNENVSTPA